MQLHQGDLAKASIRERVRLRIRAMRASRISADLLIGLIPFRRMNPISALAIDRSTRGISTLNLRSRLDLDAARQAPDGVSSFRVASTKAT